MHPGWPKFTQNLWYATPDNGLAALVYAPSSVKAFVGKGTASTISEETSYPFEESIKFILTTDKKESRFHFHFNFVFLNVVSLQ